MMHVALFVAVPVAIIWALVVFRSFRIVVGILAILVIGLFVVITNQSEVREKKAKADAVIKEEEKKAEVAKQERLKAKRWTLVQPSETQVNDTTLTSKSEGLSTHSITASIRNNSKMRITAIEAGVSVYDCRAKSTTLNFTAKQKKAAKAEDCETIGQAYETFKVSIPPGQTRGIESAISLRNLPKMQGHITYKFNIMRVKANCPSSTETFDDLDEEFGVIDELDCTIN
jgi:hypothetical protein